MISKYISSIGTELEGGYTRTAFDTFRRYVNQNRLVENLGSHEDSSVNSHIVPNQWDSNEEITFNSEDIRRILLAAKKLYSLGFKTDTSCGGHFHIRVGGSETGTRVARDIISNLPDFYKDYEEEYTKYAESKPQAMRERYLGRRTNSYCKFGYNTDAITQQINSEGKCSGRYLAINLNAVNLPSHTIEFRNMPSARTYEEYKANLIWLVKTLDMLFEKYKNKTEVGVRIPLHIARNMNDEEVKVRIPIYNMRKMMS